MHVDPAWKSLSEHAGALETMLGLLCQRLQDNRIEGRWSLCPGST